MNLNIVKSGSIHRGDVITLDNYDEGNGVIKLTNATSEQLQRVYTDHAFGTSKAKRLIMTLVEEEERAFWFAQVLQLFHLYTQTNDETSGKFEYVR